MADLTRLENSFLLKKNNEKFLKDLFGMKK